MQEQISNDRHAPGGVKRRSVLKWGSALLGATAVSGTGVFYGLKAANGTPDKNEKVVWATCNVNCGSRCPLRVHVREGQVVRIETDNTGDERFGTHEIRACLRGRSMRRWTYSPQRLKYPMKRVGKRGEGKFERISWDEALDMVSSELRRIIDTYGNEAVFVHYASGVLGGTVSRREVAYRLFNILGGSLRYYGTYSTAQISAALPYTYGKRNGNHISDIANSRLVVFFGNNPAGTRMSGGGSVYDLRQAREQSGVRTIVVDPRFTDTAATFADEWVPIRPGTDAALVAGLAHVIISEGMADEEFLKKYCLGYDQSTMPEGVPAGNSYKDYILGTGPDQTPKTPEWAANITGIPAERIRGLGREIGATKPCFICQGWGPQRHACGEQTARAVCMLSILTGNVGIQGGNTGDREGNFAVPFPRVPMGENAVKTSIPIFRWTQAIDDPTSMTDLTDGIKNKKQLEVPIKFLWNYAGNAIINQHSDCHETTRILQDESKCEMIVVLENYMTPSAKFADVLLPCCTSLEEEDLIPQGYAVEMGSLVVSEKAAEPFYESRSLFDIVNGMAQRLNVQQEFSLGMDRAQWLEYMYQKFRAIKPELPPSFKDAQKTGVFKWKRPDKPYVAFEDFRKNPEAHPLNTPSGKIEIFSERLWNISKDWKLPKGDTITALPEYHPTWEGAEDAASNSKYPLQIIGHHYKQRTHSSYGNVDWLQQVAPQEAWMNTLDAEERGIQHGDMVRVFNDRGETHVKVKVTERIMPGVMTLPQGAWYTPDKNGVDQNGCINVLTSHHPSPLAKGNPQHTNLVQVTKL
ncbi:MAG: molybdopterin-dependent oxidoreductase [Desulfovibrio sp.]|nr:molybdopterin-dependent oxidoreductase [Desulfovibrio sp.]